MVCFNERWVVYGAAKESRFLAEKDFLHSFLRQDSAKDYIKAHKNLFPGRYECYDVYVGSALRERVTFD